MLDSGVVKGPSQVQLSDQRGIVRALCLHQLVLKSKAEIDQLKEGLKVLGAMESHTTTLRTLFTASEKEPLTPGIYCVSVHC